VVVFLSTSFLATAAPIQELIKTKPKLALAQVNQTLEQEPNNSEALFYRATILQNSGRIDDAKSIYQRLIRQAPDNPEPFINLAAILADQGDIKAAQQMLIKGLNSHSSYGQIYNNLKSINSQLAAIAYQEALNKSPNNEQRISLQTTSNFVKPKTVIKEVEVIKEVLKEVVKEIKVPVEVIKEVEVVKEVIKEVEVPVEVVKEVQVVKEVIKEVKVPVEVVKEVIKEVNVPVEVIKEVEVAKALVQNIPTLKPKVVKPKQQSALPDLSSKVEAWASAWSNRNVPEYITYYIDNYSPKQGLSHRGWVRDRDLKIGGKDYISVSLRDISQKSRLNGRQIDVTFKQTYQSNTINDTVKKRLRFVKKAGNWKIIQERVIGR